VRNAKSSDGSCGEDRREMRRVAVKGTTLVAHGNKNQWNLLKRAATLGGWVSARRLVSCAQNRKQESMVHAGRGCEV
jgi:hypothetical protein